MCNLFIFLWIRSCTWHMCMTFWKRKKGFAQCYHHSQALLCVCCVLQLEHSNEPYSQEKGKLWKKKGTCLQLAFFRKAANNNSCTVSLPLSFADTQTLSQTWIQQTKHICYKMIDQHCHPSNGMLAMLRDDKWNPCAIIEHNLLQCHVYCILVKDPWGFKATQPMPWTLVNEKSLSKAINDFVSQNQTSHKWLFLKIK